MKFETCISTHKGDGLASVTFTSENREQAEEAADAMNIWSFHRIPEDGREVTESRWKPIGFGWTEGGGSGGPDIDPERFQQLPSRRRLTTREARQNRAINQSGKE